MSKEQERIDVLENILIQLHYGATPDEVQDDFDKHFTGVSAVEVAMMEQQIIAGDNPVTFEDVLELCNVHANMFRGNIDENESPDAEKPGHPVRVFKDENIALQSTLIRIRNVLAVMQEEALEDDSEIIRGLKNQYNLLGQFKSHYDRKERLFFPKMEKYGHISPPKVMWAKNDEIRELYAEAYAAMEALPEGTLEQVITTLDAFEYEFKEMVFKEEAILINILLESLTPQDWYDIALQSDTYGYSIIAPTEQWEPTLVAEAVTEKETLSIGNQVFEIEWDQQEDSVIDPDAPQLLGNGKLSVNQLRLVLNQLPLQVAYFDEQGEFRYSNRLSELDRDSMANRVKGEDRWEGNTRYEYQTLVDQAGESRGWIEIVEDVTDFRNLSAPVKTNISPVPSEVQVPTTKLLDSVDSEPISRVVSFGDTQLTITRKDAQSTIAFDQRLDFVGGQLSLEEADLILNALGIELTFVSKAKQFTYFNDCVPFEQMIFKRTPSEIGRNIELCHPPKVWPKVSKLIGELETKVRIKEHMWFTRSPESIIHISYIAAYDAEEKFQGILEIVRDIGPYQK